MYNYLHNWEFPVVTRFLPLQCLCWKNCCLTVHDTYFKILFHLQLRTVNTLHFMKIIELLRFDFYAVIFYCIHRSKKKGIDLLLYPVNFCFVLCALKANKKEGVLLLVFFVLFLIVDVKIVWILYSCLKQSSPYLFTVIPFTIHNTHWHTYGNNNMRRP